MPEAASRASLTALAPGVYAWLEEPHCIGRPNAGVVVDEDGATVVDTLMVPSQAARLAAAVSDLGRPVPRVVLTSGHIEFAGGTSHFRLAAVYGSALTSAHLDQPPNIEAYKAFMPKFGEEFEGLETRPVSHVVDSPVMLTPAVEVIPIGGHTPGNLMVRVPAAGVLFAGGMCSFGVTPLAFQGDPAAWAQALSAVADLAETIVPGHGPVGGSAQVQELQAYLVACVEADGEVSAIPAGPWDGWADRHLDAINVERAHLLSRGEDRIPSSMLRAIGSE
ncbi:MAG TPA: MBL fold metallo-hydrolase [Acidimicrobiales bacterium]|nr:MBL fold metallo-hydrolase [Acidimicrobiales bacterium]